MNPSTDCRTHPDLVVKFCQALYALAMGEDDAAAQEASLTPYGLGCPVSIETHRTAARLLRADAYRLEPMVGLDSDAGHRHAG